MIKAGHRDRPAAAEVRRGDGGARTIRLTLLFRAYCHLCDEMLAAVAPLAAAHGAAVDVIDVDAPEHAALEAAWGDAVPVLFAGPPAPERELCRFRLDRARLDDALRIRCGGDA